MISDDAANDNENDGNAFMVVVALVDHRTPFSESSALIWVLRAHKSFDRTIYRNVFLST